MFISQVTSPEEGTPPAPKLPGTAVGGRGMHDAEEGALSA